MCFLIKGNKDNKPIPKIANKDIIVWKAIYNDGWGWMYNLWINKREVKWEKGWWYYETTSFISEKYSEFHKGWVYKANCFHSIISKEHCTVDYVNPDYEKLQKFIIPKSALYIKNKRQYISDQIIYPIQ